MNNWIKIIFVLFCFSISFHWGIEAKEFKCNHDKLAKEYPLLFKKTVYTTIVNNHKVVCNVVKQNKQGSYTMSNCEDYNTYLNVNNIEMKVMIF